MGALRANWRSQPSYFASQQAGRFRDDYAAQLRATSMAATKAEIEAGHRQVKAAARDLAPAEAGAYDHVAGDGQEEATQVWQQESCQ